MTLPGDTGELGRELLAAYELARVAGQTVVEIRDRGPLAVDMKPGDEPVTVADRTASELIVAGLRERFPDDRVVSEEVPLTDELAASRVWLVDPIDGTKDFIRGTDGFSVMIGLVRDGTPVLGVVHQPTRERTFFATPDGAYVQTGSELAPIAVSQIATAGDARLVASASHRTAVIDQVKQRLGIADEQNVGSVGVKLCLIALGVRDLYVNPTSKTKAWDTCAPEAILVRAGGRLTDLFGAAIDYRVVAQPRGLVASNGRVHDEVLAKVAPLFGHLRRPA
jgi:3'(2'), 5'-bisphosphate nucleotidase